MSRLTQQQAERAVEWFLFVRNMEDWTVYVDVTDEVPEWTGDDDSTSPLALASIATSYKEAMLWVSPKRCRNAGSQWLGEPADELAALFHECCHVWAVDVGLESSEKPAAMANEQAWNADGDFFAAAYRAKVMR